MGQLKIAAKLCPYVALHYREDDRCLHVVLLCDILLHMSTKPVKTRATTALDMFGMGWSRAGFT